MITDPLLRASLTIQMATRRFHLQQEAYERLIEGAWPDGYAAYYRRYHALSASERAAHDEALDEALPDDNELHAVIQIDLLERRMAQPDLMTCSGDDLEFLNFVRSHLRDGLDRHWAADFDGAVRAIEVAVTKLDWLLNERPKRNNHRVRGLDRREDLRDELRAILADLRFALGGLTVRQVA